jgi:hypothetical protein
MCFNYSSDCGIHIIPFLRCLYVYGNPALAPMPRGRKSKFRDFLSRVTLYIRLLKCSSSDRIRNIHNVPSHVYITHSLLFDFLCLTHTELLEFSLLKALLSNFTASTFYCVLLRESLILCAVRKLYTIVQSSEEMACMQSKNARNGTSHVSKLIHQIAVCLYIFSTPCLIQCLPKYLSFS